MAGYFDSFKLSLRTLTGLPLRGSAMPSLGLTRASVPATLQISMPTLQANPLPLVNYQLQEPVFLACSEPPVKENVMSTAAVVPAPAATTAAPKQKPGFVRFIDHVGHFFAAEGPAVLKVAVDAEPILALTPFGPEYTLVVNSIVNAQRIATLSMQAGATLSGEQKMALALAAVMPALSEILKAKGVTADVEKAIAGFVQAVYDLHAGPAVLAAA